MLAVREHLVLVRQVRPARVDEVDARQAVLLGDRLRAQVLLDRHRVVGAALHGRVVAHDHAVGAAHRPDARDEARARHLVVVLAVRREASDLEKGRARIDQPLDAVARQELAAREVARGGTFSPPPAGDAFGGGGDLVDLPQQRLAVRAVRVAADIERGADPHRPPPATAGPARTGALTRSPANSSRPISMRRISLVPAPIS